LEKVTKWTKRDWMNRENNKYQESTLNKNRQRAYLGNSLPKELGNY
jgi:hypothetical protein